MDEYMLKCRVCGGKLETVFIDGEDYLLHQSSERFGVVYCKKCNIGYGTPIISGKELAKYYPSHYEAYVVKKGPLDFIQRIKYASDIQMISSYAEKHKINIKSVYELGAGRGEFLDALRKNTDFSDSKLGGTELSEDGCNVAKEHYDIELDNSDAEEYVFKTKNNLIVMRHVLEHFNKFDDVLNNVFKNGLCEEGMLFIKVPCMDSYDALKYGKFWRGYEMPRHRVLFTERGLKKILEDIGFRDVRCIREVVPSSHDETVQFKNKGRIYRNSRLKWIRFIFYQPILALRKKSADRIIVMAHK